jgi:hypothetical protein
MNPAFFFEKFSVNAVAVFQYRTFPLPQRPFPTAVGKLDETAFLSHHSLGTKSVNAAFEQWQKSHLLNAFY